MDESARQDQKNSETHQAQHPLFNDTPLTLKKRDGTLTSLDIKKIERTYQRYSSDLPAISIPLLIKETVKNLFEGASTQEVEKALISASVTAIEKDPEYDTLATRLLLQHTYKDTFGLSVQNAAQLETLYRDAFIKGISAGITAGILNPQLATYDLARIASLIVIERDTLFTYLGLQTVVDRYLLKVNNQRLETPQAFWLRIAMGLALKEKDFYKYTQEFYEVLSNLRYISSTPTLFHSGYIGSQLSSCFLTTVKDDLGHIFKCIGDNAQIAKWAGGIGNDWTNIRGTGSLIRSIHATSQGVIPFLKITNDVVVGITKSGIRRGGTVVYLETWHFDIEDFLDLRRNTGDERRRTPDMNTANWIPDLFMKRVEQDAEWTLFSPDEVPDLHSLYGKEFEKRYIFYEQQAQEGKIKIFRTISALKLWRKMLTRLFETGHPWITFKDPCNIRSPQDHAGVIHSSNLCTEVTLNTSEEETAVCNLGSINLARHIKDGVLNEPLLQKTITTAIRMLDNVIDLNFYPTKETRLSNMRHRPIGLGVMGFQDALFQLDVPFSTSEAIDIADWLQEKISYYAIQASSNLAVEKGAYESYKGSKWDRGIFPVDTLDLLEQERGQRIEVSRIARMDWKSLKEKVKLQGMRNSNVMAIAPTATIANIAGCYPCIEPLYRNIYVKSNIAGEFTIVNRELITDLKKIGLWDQEMLDQLKYYDGDITAIASVPERLKRKYQSAFELDPLHMIKITAARGKWIDQSQSHNVFMKGVDGKKLHDIYTSAWKAGFKTTYYLRTLGATQIEKSTLDAQKYGYTQKREYNAFNAQEDSSSTTSSIRPALISPLSPQEKLSCEIDQSCEACQ